MKLKINYKEKYKYYNHTLFLCIVLTFHGLKNVFCLNLACASFKTEIISLPVRRSEHKIIAPQRRHIFLFSTKKWNRIRYSQAYTANQQPCTPLKKEQTCEQHHKREEQKKTNDLPFVFSYAP